MKTLSPYHWKVNEYVHLYYNANQHVYYFQDHYVNSLRISKQDFKSRTRALNAYHNHRIIWEG